MDAIAIFLEESHFRAAELFHQQFDATAALKFSPKIIVLSRLKVDDLRRAGDVHLIPLFPLCDISPSEIEQQAPAWAEQIKTAPELNEEERRSLIGLLGGFMSHRNKALSRNLLNKILGGLYMEDTLVGQEIMRLGTQRMLLKQIAARFGAVPESIRQKIQEIDNDDDLDQIAIALFKIQSVDELKNLVN